VTRLTAAELLVNTVRRALEDLTAYRLTTRTKQEQGKADLWQAVDWARERLE
jgi:hypothetical protein